MGINIPCNPRPRFCLNDGSDETSNHKWWSCALLIFDSVSQEMHLVNIGTSNMCGNATSTNDKSKDLEKDNCIIAQISKR